MVAETANVSNIAQLALVLHYVTDTGVPQCFDGAAVTSGLNRVKESIYGLIHTLLCTSTEFSTDSRCLKAYRMHFF